jgi:hypothetical protein
LFSFLKLWVGCLTAQFKTKQFFFSFGPTELSRYCGYSLTLHFLPLTTIDNKKMIN